MTLRVFDVILTNEGGEPVLYDVAAASEEEALAEAWRRYRELPYVDGAQPPSWTWARIGPAQRRFGGERPCEIGGRLHFADHCQ